MLLVDMKSDDLSRTSNKIIVYMKVLTFNFVRRYNCCLTDAHKEGNVGMIYASILEAVAFG